MQDALTKTNLYAQNLNKWDPLPSWGKFFINIGRYVAERESNTEKNRLVIGLAIPTRNYASALAALGIVITREKFHTNSFDINRHFADIRRLKTGTSVSFNYQGKELPAIYEGINDIDGQPRLRIRVQSTETGGLTHLISLKESSKIFIAAKPVLSLPKKAKGQSIIVYNKFLNILIDKVNAADLFAHPRLDCVVIGSTSTLKHEITDIRFACKSTENTFQKGTLQDVLRVRNFYITGNQAYRSEILSIKGNKTPQTANGSLPYVTIFDGASGFIKSRDNWRNSHWIILLDRTETHFQEAVKIVNDEYGYRVIDETPNLPAIPPPFEIVLYQESRP